MRILIKGARVLDPGKQDGIKTILIEGQTIAAVLDPSDPVPGGEANLDVVNADGLVLVPGLMDIHVHLREPGHEYKETIATGTAAAARGGFTAVCAMPNTQPVNDNAQVTGFILERPGLLKVPGCIRWVRSPEGRPGASCRNTGYAAGWDRSGIR